MRLHTKGCKLDSRHQTKDQQHEAAPEGSNSIEQEATQYVWSSDRVKC